MSKLLNDNELEKYRSEGYVALRNFFDETEDISPVVDGYAKLVDALATIYIQRINPDLQNAYLRRTFPERLSMLLGLSGGTILHHFIPNLIHYANASHQPLRPNLPSSQIPELFEFISNTKLIDAVECLIGPEISVSPSYQINFKLAPKYLDLVQRIAQENRREVSDLDGFYSVYVEGATPLHTDAHYYLSDAYRSDIVVAWIPMSDASLERGSLLVVPGSHNSGILSHAFSDVITSQAAPVETNVGDLVLFHFKLIHGSLANESDNGLRWSFNFRYHPTGQPSGRPFLPGFRVRSRKAQHTELKSPKIWADMWQAALQNLATTDLPLPPTDPIPIQEAEAITAQWKNLVPDELSWLRLGA